MLNKLLMVHDKEEENQIKEKLMMRSGIPIEYITFENVYFNGNSEDYVHLMLIDDKTIPFKKDLIFIHGISGSSLFYHGILRVLSRKFRIFALDIPGMGCSSRNDIQFKDFSASEEYFLDRIKTVLDKYKLQKDLTLVGHSLGGYISGLFSIKYPEMVKNLILLSPVGISSTYYKFLFENQIATMMMKKFYEIKYPPTSSLKLFSIWGDFLLTFNLDLYFKDSWMKDDKEGWNLFKQLVSVIYRNFCCSERALFWMFDSDLRAYKTLTQHYEKLKDINILFFYGDKDWNPVEPAKDLQELIPSVEIEIVRNSTHKLYCENNYDLLAEKIIEYEMRHSSSSLLLQE